MTPGKKINAIVILPVRDLVEITELLNDECFAIISSNASLREMRRALDDVRSGSQYISTQLSKALLDELRQIQNSDLSLLIKELTQRENEIAILISQGLSTKEISKKLSISKDTVATHRKHILKKLGLKNSSALTNHVLNRHKYRRNVAMKSDINIPANED